jgi:hypothetical protein
LREAAEVKQLTFQRHQPGCRVAGVPKSWPLIRSDMVGVRPCSERSRRRNISTGCQCLEIHTLGQAEHRVADSRATCSALMFGQQSGSGPHHRASSLGLGGCSNFAGPDRWVFRGRRKPGGRRCCSRTNNFLNCYIR